MIEKKSSFTSHAESYDFSKRSEQKGRKKEDNVCAIFDVKKSHSSVDKGNKIRPPAGSVNGKKRVMTKLNCCGTPS